jgi:phage gp36-like protein
MAYATQDQIQMAAGGADRLLALADWDGDGAIDAAVIAEAQARADGWIDGYLRMHYAIPIATPTDTLKRLAADECVYWMRCNRGMALGEHDVQARKDREGQLEQMRDRKLLPDDPAPAASTVAQRPSVVIENTCELSRDSMRGMW